MLVVQILWIIKIPNQQINKKAVRANAVRHVI